MAKPAVILIGADKGGVGKTTVARTLIDYFGAHQTPTRAFDTESPRGTLKRFHPELTEVVDVTSVSDQMKIFDTLGSADAKVTVIDVRAGLLSSTLQALTDIGRRRNHHSEAERDGVRAGGSGQRALRLVCRQQGRQERSGKLFLRSARLCSSLAWQCLG
jgi:hypothetical protein